jgi:hypothetical protein
MCPFAAQNYQISLLLGFNAKAIRMENIMFLVPKNYSILVRVSLFFLVRKLFQKLFW